MDGWMMGGRVHGLRMNRSGGGGCVEGWGRDEWVGGLTDDG